MNLSCGERPVCLPVRTTSGPSAAMIPSPERMASSYSSATDRFARTWRPRRGRAGWREDAPVLGGSLRVCTAAIWSPFAPRAGSDRPELIRVVDRPRLDPRDRRSWPIERRESASAVPGILHRGTIGCELVPKYRVAGMLGVCADGPEQPFRGRSDGDAGRDDARDWHDSLLNA